MSGQKVPLPYAIGPATILPGGGWSFWLNHYLTYFKRAPYSLVGSRYIE